jgi:hypothetical protein
VLVRSAGAPPACAAGFTWSGGDAAEVAGAGGDRDADLAMDADTCP